MGIKFLCSPEVRNSSMAELAGSAALSEFTEALSPAHIKRDVISPSLQEAKSLPESSDTLEVLHNPCRSQQEKLQGNS